MRYLRNLLSLVILVSCPCLAEVYRWTDENGKLHFSDVKPMTRSTSVERLDAENPGSETPIRNNLAHLEAGSNGVGPLKLGLFDNREAILGPRKISELYKTAVIVKTENGHGSGVYLTEDYVLTNFHVVNGSKFMQIITDNNKQEATVARVRKYRDVALLKLTHKHRGEVARVTRFAPEIGDDLTLITTPLDTSLSNTVTRGIMSGARQIDSTGRFSQKIPVYQTDAALNRGSSGGPAFNKNGELIGISVSGLLGNDGGSLNVNFLIPIDDALRALHIE